MESQLNNPIINSTQKDRISNVKYIIYNIILVLIILFLWGYVQDYYNFYDAQKTEISQMSDNKSLLNTKLQNNKAIADILSSMSGKNNAILQCINDNICSELDVKISKNMKNIRSYYILTNIGTGDIQSDVINNDINKNLLSYNSQSLGSIDSLSIKKGSIIDKKNNISKVPIEMIVKFADTGKLVRFLQNIEKTISENGGLLYKISDVYYNFTSDEGLRISMDLYYVNTSKKILTDTGFQAE